MCPTCTLRCRYIYVVCILVILLYILTWEAAICALSYGYLGWPRGGMLMSVGSPLTISPYTFRKTFLHNSNFLHGACPIIPPWMRRPDVRATISFMNLTTRTFFTHIKNLHGHYIAVLDVTIKIHLGYITFLFESQLANKFPVHNILVLVQRWYCQWRYRGGW